VSSALAGYAEDAPALIPHWFAIEPADVHAPVLHLLPAAPARVLDIGAGVGRDAAWFAGRGHAVLAVEPVDALREAGMTAYAQTPGIEWQNDRLPDLTSLMARGETFDLVMLTAVWAHLNEEERRIAMANIGKLVAKGGRLIMSIRRGWTPPNHPVFDVTAFETVDLAEAAGLDAIFSDISESIQEMNRANGVKWLRLAFEKNT
jgi:SAM-dependent methyltransferase